MEEQSRMKKRTPLKLLLVLALAALILESGIVSQLASQKVVPSSGTILLPLRSAIYQDSNCTLTLPYVDWGLVTTGSNKTITVFAKNEGGMASTLMLGTSNWNPINASDYMSLDWNYIDVPLYPNDVIPITMKLQVSTNLKGVRDFAFDIVIFSFGLSLGRNASLTIPSTGGLPGTRILTIQPASIGGQITEITGVSQADYGRYNFDFDQTVNVTTQPRLIAPPGVLPVFKGWAINPEPLWWRELNPNSTSTTIQLRIRGDYSLKTYYETPTPQESWNFRIADIMPLRSATPYDGSNMDAILNDLLNASPNNEITHVQLRIYWRSDPAPENNFDTSYTIPVLGSPDPDQQRLMNRWQTEITSGIAKVRARGFKVEFAISVSWIPGQSTNQPPTMGWNQREQDYPLWMAAGGGETFLLNYLANVLRPVAEFIKDYLEDGDIFMVNFELNYPTSDFTWSHNPTYTYIIDETRRIFLNAGKNILLTLDHCGWFDDRGLGLADVPGILGATYLKALDFISISHWIPELTAGDIPVEIPVPPESLRWKMADAQFANMNFEVRGTGYGGVPAIEGRNFMEDFQQLFETMGRPVLMNTGWENLHWVTTSNPKRPQQDLKLDNQEQAEAWAGRLLALQTQEWCAGQDFERYVEHPNYATPNTSWRKKPAETEIIEGIRRILRLKTAQQNSSVQSVTELKIKDGSISVIQYILTQGRSLFPFTLGCNLQLGHRRHLRLPRICSDV